MDINKLIMDIGFNSTNIIMTDREMNSCIKNARIEVRKKYIKKLKKMKQEYVNIISHINKEIHTTANNYKQNIFDSYNNNDYNNITINDIYYNMLQEDIDNIIIDKLSIFFDKEYIKNNIVIAKNEKHKTVIVEPFEISNKNINSMIPDSIIMYNIGGKDNNDL